MIGLNVALSINLIDPKECPIVNGDFGIIPGTKLITLNGELAQIERCGNTFDLPCNSRVDNLAGAINYCNTYANICTSFVYTDGIVTIVDSQAVQSSDSNYDLYSRQYNIKNLT